MDSNESQIAAFLAKYTPAIETQLRDARTRLRAAFPRGYELVFDNYNALVFGISASERSRESFISIAGYPQWVTLFFLRGVDLHDPEGLLEGSGVQVRGVRLKSAADLGLPAVRALIAQAAAAQADALKSAPPLTTIVKPPSAKQRSRRPSS
ncbi:MAG: DUF1801 domain-containing protein [Proteobacteria bacterium]|nr:DUF1801 domain-containing protein [Pseudomonadota bacterium]